MRTNIVIGAKKPLPSDRTLFPALSSQRTFSINPIDVNYHPGSARYALHARVAALPLADMPGLGDIDSGCLPTQTI